MAAHLTRRATVAAFALLTSVSLALTGCTDSVFGGGGEVNSVDEQLSSRIDEAVESAMQLAGANTAIVGVWSSAGEYVHAYGEGVSPNSPIRAAQASQPVMCALLLELVEDGTVSLNREVSKDLPRQVGIEGITYGMLCDATSGLADYKSQLVDIFANNPTRGWSDRELIAHALAHSPLAAPGAEQQVSDTDTVLLGRALSDRTDQSLHELLNTHVFDAAQMGSSYFPVDPLIDVKLPGGGMNGFTYQFAGGQPVCTVSTPVEGGAEGETTETAVEPTPVEEVSPSMLQGAGATVTTVTDLKRFYEQYLSKAFGSEENAALITTAPQAAEAPAGEAAEGGAAATAPTWTFGLEKQGGFYGMSGAMTGTLTAAYHDPTSGFTVVVTLNNSSAGANFVRALALELAAVSAADVGWSADEQRAVLQELAVCQPATEEAPAE